MSGELLGIAGAVLLHAATVAYWAGRVSARLEGLTRRLELLELRRAAPVPVTVFPSEYRCAETTP